IAREWGLCTVRLTEEQILEVLKGVEDPELHISLVDLNMIRNINIEGTKVDLDVILTIQGCPLKATIHDDVVNAVKSVGATEVDVRFGSMTDQERAELSARLRGGSGQAGPDEVSPILSPDSSVTFIA